MNKKVMAVAVAGLFAAPGVALAQKSTVEIYGRLDLGLDHYEATGSNIAGADREGRLRVFNNSSRVGFRGTEDLGNGLRAIFQIESGVSVDSGSNIGQNNTANSSYGFWASRDSFVGLDSNYGRLSFGRQSIYWANGVNAQFAANYINTELPWTNGTVLGRVSAAPGSVSRQSNTVAYTTPRFGGFNGTLSYSPSTGEAVQGLVAGAGSDTDGAVWGITVRGTFGAFYGQFDYANSTLNTPIPAAIQPEAALFKLGGSWGYMPGARVGVIWVRIENNNVAAASGAAGADVDQDGFTINWEHTFGNVQAMAQYGWTGDMKGCAVATTTVGTGCTNTKATGFMLGARYFLSKRTWVYASYNQVDNKANNFADYVGGGITATNTAGAGGTPFGADPRIIALGIHHNF